MNKKKKKNKQNRTLNFSLFQNRSSSSFVWLLGNFLCLEEVPTDREAFMLYNLGPNYAGSLDVDLDRYYIYEMVNEKTAKLPEDLVALLIDPSQGNFSYLQDKIMFILSIRSMVVGKEKKKKN